MATWRSKKLSLKYYPWKEEALNRDNYLCVDCNSTDSQLIVHHVDESRKNGWRSMNNSLDNLVTLCRSCHAKRHGQNLRYSNPNLSLIIELRDQGNTYQQIGKHLGISRQRVHQIIKSHI